MEKAVVSRVIVDSLRTMQFMSPTDVCTISAIYKLANIRSPIHGIDRTLVQTFEEFLVRAERAFTTSLSLPDLLDLYVELLHVSSAHPNLRAKSDRIQDALAARLRLDESIPYTLRLTRLVDAVGTRMDQEIAQVLSRAALSRVTVFVREDNILSHKSESVSEDLLALDRVFSQIGLQPHPDFVEAVRRFIC